MHSRRCVRIRRYFDLSIPTADDEQPNERQARKQIVGCVGQIRNRLRKNAFLLRHKIEFGFSRNLFDGCAVGAVVSLYFFRCVQPSSVAFWLTAFLEVVYVFSLVLGKFILNRFGHYYAVMLYDQYLSS